MVYEEIAFFMGKKELYKLEKGFFTTHLAIVLLIQTFSKILHQDT